MIEPDNTTDVIIIGGGPSGLSAAFWCAELGLRASLLERDEEFGGQLRRAYNPITNYLGICAANGLELRDRFLDHSAKLAYGRHLGAEIESVDLEKKLVRFAGGKKVSARAIIIATGVRREKLNIPGEDEFRGKGILESGVGEKAKVTGKRIAIVGGGDAAIENAVLLSEVAEKVFVVHRRENFTARSEFMHRAVASENVQMINPASVSQILGNSSVEGVSIRNHRSGEDVVLQVDHVLIRIGVRPNTELFSGQLALDASGYVIADGKVMSNVPDVYAIGDVANPDTPTLSGAVGTGATAAKAILARLQPS